MASYASEVKKELTSLEVHPEHAKAELAAFLRMNGVLNLHDHQFSLDITTENPAIARRKPNPVTRESQSFLVRRAGDSPAEWPRRQIVRRCIERLQTGIAGPDFGSGHRRPVRTLHIPEA